MSETTAESINNLRSKMLATALPSTEVEVYLMGSAEPDTVLVEGVSKSRYERIIAADYTDKPYDASDKLIQVCTYHPETKQLIFDEEHLVHFAEIPMNMNGWYKKLAEAVDYVLGFRPLPPQGDGRFDEIIDAARELQRVAQDGEELDRNLVAELAKNIAKGVEFLKPEVQAGNVITR